MLENPGLNVSGNDTQRGERREDPALMPHVDSRRLLAGGRELVIDHAGQQYRLRLTRNDKLILTK